MEKKPLEQISNYYRSLSLQQKALIGGSVLATVILILVLTFFLNEPTYTALYSNLSEEDASKVVEYLTAQKIQYKIDDNGTTIKVPKDKLYETRLSLAGKGIPTSGSIGYEVFDNSPMGMSEFMQKLNFKRALEGELSRTILGQEGVEGVRVHIVFPEKTVFREEEKQPTASIVLKLKNNFTLPRSSAAAIVNLVSTAVEGLTPGKITLLDTRGRLLWKEDEDNTIAFSSAKQYEIKNTVENYLAQKAQTILDNVLGYGNSMIQVNADINFDQVEKTMELYDPETQVVVSEQTIKSQNVGTNQSDSTAQANENVTTNYEISKTIEKVIEGSGNIKRLTVAAVINDVAKQVVKDDKTETVYEPRSSEQLKKLEEIIKNSVGINTDRDDQFSIVNISFETQSNEEYSEESGSFFTDIDGITNLVLVIIAIGASLFLLKGLMNKLKSGNAIFGEANYTMEAADRNSLALNGGIPPQLAAIKKSKEALPLGDIGDDISDEAIRKKNQQERISTYVAKNPPEAAKLINSWLHEDESR